MLYYTSSCSFKLFCFLECSYALYCFGALILSTVFSVMTLLSVVYTSSIFKPLFLLWRLLKCLLLLESIVWPLLLLFIKISVFRFLRLFIALCTLRLLCFTEIYWFWSSVLLSQCLLWCFLHWILSNVTFVGLFSLIDPVVNFNYFVN